MKKLFAFLALLMALLASPPLANAWNFTNYDDINKIELNANGFNSATSGSDWQRKEFHLDTTNKYWWMLVKPSKTTIEFTLVVSDKSNNEHHFQNWSSNRTTEVSPGGSFEYAIVGDNRSDNVKNFYFNNLSTDKVYAIRIYEHYGDVVKGDVAIDEVTGWKLHGQFTGDGWAEIGNAFSAGGSQITFTPTRTTGSFGLKALAGSNQVGWLSGGEFSNSSTTHDINASSANCSFNWTANTQYTATLTVGSDPESSSLKIEKPQTYKTVTFYVNTANQSDNYKKMHLWYNDGSSDHVMLNNYPGSLLGSIGSSHTNVVETATDRAYEWKYEVTIPEGTTLKFLLSKNGNEDESHKTGDQTVTGNNENKVYTIDSSANSGAWTTWTEPATTPTFPENLYIYGRINGIWGTTKKCDVSGASSGIYKWNSVVMFNNQGEFFIHDNNSTRYVPSTGSNYPNPPVSTTEATYLDYKSQGDNPYAAWQNIPTGTYDIEIDLNAGGKVKLTPVTVVTPSYGPSTIYLYKKNTGNWDAKVGTATNNNGVFVFSGVSLTAGEEIVLKYEEIDGWNKFINYKDGDLKEFCAGSETTSTSDFQKDRNAGVWKVGSTATYTITVRFTSDNEGTFTATRSSGGETLAVNMPLTKKSFEGKNHYFLVGSRMSDWHLQPEWEFEKVDATTYKIRGRYMYDGMIGVGKATNYDDYTHQKFKLYAHASDAGGYVFDKDNLNANNLQEKWGDAQGYVNYDGSTRNFFNWKNGGYSPNAMYWAYDERSNNFQDTRTDLANQDKGFEARANGFGIWVDEITLTVDGSGNPTALTFTTPKHDDNQRIFQLCGSDIYNRDLSELAPGKETQSFCREPLDNNAWGQAWIQYDDNGRPYYDANGRFIYQTVFQKDWFEEHPSYFHVTKGDLDNQITSDDITFKNVSRMTDEEKADDPYYDWYINIKGTHTFRKNVTSESEIEVGDIHYYERLDGATKAGNDGDRTSSAWQCFVVKDVWVSGEFKIWSGAGGNFPMYEASWGNVERLRWNGPNGGPNGNATDRLEVLGYDLYQGEGGNMSNPVSVYANYMNIDDVNYKTKNGDAQFFNRIVLWYDGNFNRSVIQFISETASPQIHIEANGRNHIDYNWQIAGLTDATNGKMVDSYTITRYNVVKGVETPIGDLENDYDGTKTASQLNALVSGDHTDPATLAPGTYIYKVTVNYADGSTKSAKSNRVTLYDADANKIVPRLYAAQLLELTHKGLVKLVGETQAASIENTYLKSYMTFHTSVSGKYYLINSKDADHTKIQIVDVDDTEADNMLVNITDGIADANGDPYFYWTSDYYMRALDADEFDRTIERFKDNDLIQQAEAVVPSVSIYEGTNSDAAQTARLSEVVDGEGNRYYGTIMHRGGKLTKTSFTAQLHYEFDETQTRDTEATLPDVTPVLPNPYYFRYYYDYENESTDMTQHEVLGNYDYLKVTVPSAVVGTKDEGNIFHGTPQTVLIRVEDLDPRVLNCYMVFKRPNVSDEILAAYDIDYTVEFSSSDGVTAIGGSGVYRDKDINTNPYTPGTTGGGRGRYEFKIAQVNPKSAVWPIMKVTKTEYKANATHSGYGNLTASFRNPLKVEATNNPVTKEGSVAALYLGYLAPGKSAFGHLNESSDRYDWMYKGHVELQNTDDVHQKVNGQDITDSHLTLSPKLFMVETYLKNDNDSYNCYEYVVRHIENHSDNANWTGNYIDEAKGIKEYELNDAGAIAGDPDPLIYTFIAKGFPFGDGNDGVPERPIVAFTPVYVYFHDVEGESTGTANNATPIQLTKISGSDPAPRRNAPVMRDMGTGDGVGLDPDPTLAQPMLHINNTNMNASNVISIDAPEIAGKFVAVSGKPSDSSKATNLDNTTTGIENVAYGVSGGDVEYYNIQGVKVENPMPGQVYIVKQGAQVSKQLMK